MLPLNPALAATFRPSVMEARRWLDGVTFPPDRPLINVSQAAPVDPPPEGLRAAIAASGPTTTKSTLLRWQKSITAAWSAMSTGTLLPGTSASTCRPLALAIFTVRADIWQAFLDMVDPG